MSSVPRRRRYYEGATTSHPASRPLLVRDRVPRGPPGFVLAEALPGGWRSRPSLGRLVRRRPGSGWRPRGRGGISQVPRRSIPCLCPAPRPRPNQWSLTKAVPPMLPPRPTRRRLQRSHDLEAATGLQHPLPTLRTRRCRRPRKARFRLAGWPLPGEGRTLRIATKGFRALSRRPPFQGLPCRKLSPLDRIERPPSLIALQSAIAARIPKIDLPDVMLEAAARSGFADAFTHVSERHARVEEFTTSLCGGLIAQACNIGFEPMVRTDQPALSRNRLSWVSQNFIRPETIAAANARIVAAQNALPIAHVWGNGEVASADGIRFVAPGNAIHAGANPKYFGAGRGITYYNLVSDQFTGLNAIVVPGTLRDSLLILGLLLDQETDLKPAEVMTDTAAYADTVFGLFWLLGYQFSPRLADIGDARFWRIDRTADYGPLDSLARHRVDVELIRRNWEDLLRLAGSLKLGRIHAGAIMRVLQAKDRPTTLARALAELGRIIKTLHMLGYIDSKEKRRRILPQLNRQEFRHRLARRVCHGDRGEIRKAHRQEQEEQLGALGLTLNAIALWNTTYIQAAVDQLTREGWDISEADIARVSPLLFKHITFLGRYAFDLPQAIAEGALRPLLNPTSE